MSNDYSEGFFSIFTLVLVHLALSLRFLCVVVESIVEERVRICLPLWNCDDGWQAFPLYKIQAYTAYSSLLVPVVAASCLVMGPVEPREGQIRMLGA